MLAGNPHAGMGEPGGRLQNPTRRLSYSNATCQHNQCASSSFQLRQAPDCGCPGYYPPCYKTRTRAAIAGCCPVKNKRGFIQGSGRWRDPPDAVARQYPERRCHKARGACDTAANHFQHGRIDQSAFYPRANWRHGAPAFQSRGFADRKADRPATRQQGSLAVRTADTGCQTAGRRVA